MEVDRGANTGYSFIATVIASGIIGFAVDKFFPTAPWGLLGFLIIGIVYATYKAQIAMQETSTRPPENPNENPDDKKDDKKV